MGPNLKRPVMKGPRKSCRYDLDHFPYQIPSHFAWLIAKEKKETEVKKPEHLWRLILRGHYVNVWAVTI